MVDLKGGCCQKCGGIFGLPAMCFHHNKGIKNFTLSNNIYSVKSEEEIMKELELVELLCQNCHAIVHHEENEKRIEKCPIKDNSKRFKEKGKERKRCLVEMKGGKCEYCGYKSNVLDTMTFDHIGDRKFYLAACKLLTKWDKVVDEVSKCMLLCRNCHVLKNQLKNGDRHTPIHDIVWS